MMRCSVLFCLFCLSATVTGSQDMSLSYNASSRQLQLKCPGVTAKSDETLLYVQLKRDPDVGNATILATWEDSSANSHDGRVEARYESYTYPLAAVVSHVTCYDEASYLCNVKTRSSSKGPQDLTREVRFDFRGDVSKPVITQTPLKARYEVGEQLSLTCSAHISNTSNSIVWEIRRPGAEFQPVTDRSLGREVQTKDRHCSLESRQELTRIVQQEDDGAVFQCRLRESHHHSRVILAVSTDKPDCPTAEPVAVQALEGGSPSALQTDIARTGSVVYNDQGETKESPQVKILTIVSVVSGVALLLALMAMVYMLKRVKRKPTERLIFVDGASSSASDYTVNERHLPDIPTRTNDNTTPKWVEDHRRPSATTRALYPQLDNSTASIYVSMTGLDTIPRTPAYVKAAEEGEGGDHSGPLRRLDRSESVYSNQEVEGGQGA